MELAYERLSCSVWYQLLTCFLCTVTNIYPRKFRRLEKCWSTVPPQLLIWSSVLITIPQKEITSPGIRILQDKIASLISAVIRFLIPLSCWLKWLILKPASHPNLAAIMDNKYYPEKSKPGQGRILWFILAAREVTLLVVNLPQAKPGESQAPRTTLPRICWSGSH